MKDKLRKIRSNSGYTHQNVHRQSIRPSKSLKLTNLPERNPDVKYRMDLDLKAHTKQR